MNETGDKHIRQFNHEAIVAHINNCGAKDLRTALVELPLKKLELLHPDGLNLRLSCDALGH